MDKCGGYVDEVLTYPQSKAKNVDNFVDRWVKFDILGRKLVKKGDKFQDIGVNEQKYNVDKM